VTNGPVGYYESSTLVEGFGTLVVICSELGTNFDVIFADTKSSPELLEQHYAYI
jgi:hypothetical protein